MLTKPCDFAIGCALVLLGAFCFSTKSILVKLCYEASNQVDAITLMALRMLFSLPFFLVVACWRTPKLAALTKFQWLQLIGIGLIGYYLASYLDFKGLKYISASLERVILFIYPTFVVVFSAIIYRRTISLAVGLALGLSYAGVLLVFSEQLSFSNDSLIGSELVLGSAIVFAVFIMGSGIMVHSIGATRFTAYSMTIASCATLVHFFGVHGMDIDTLPKNVYVLVLIMAIFATVVPAFLLNAGIYRVGAGTAAIISSVGPIATLLLANSFLHEPITLLQLAGTFLVLAGVSVVGMAKT